MHGAPWEVLTSMAIFGVGLGTAFAALGNLVVEAVEPHQTGAAGGMNTVMRMVGGALCGQLSATFIAAHTRADGFPAELGYTQAWGTAAAFLLVCTLAAFLVPRRRPFSPPLLEADAATALAEEAAR
jgi:MFS family permease